MLNVTSVTNVTSAAETMTPQSRSKFEHLIKNLKESNEDEKLVVYKVMEIAETHKNIKITDFVPYKGEPKDKYSIEFLWNIGAANYVGSGNRHKHSHGRHHKKRRRY